MSCDNEDGGYVDPAFSRRFTEALVKAKDAELVALAAGPVYPKAASDEALCRFYLGLRNAALDRELFNAAIQHPFWPL